jgi:integrase/recombinase XerD
MPSSTRSRPSETPPVVIRDIPAGSSPLPSRSPAETANPLPQLKAFLLYLATERGLADNSVHAYRRDLEDADRFFAERRKTLMTGDGVDYREYLQDVSRRGRATKTLARRLAAVRTFLKWREGEGEDVQEILQQLERPKPERSLPKVLSREQVNRLIGAPDPESPLFTRDVAILELLYACGLRATELCELTIRNVNLDVGAARVFGKGSKERIVPIGQAAREAITRYFEECRPGLERADSETLFLSRTGKPLERVALWMIVEKYGRSSGLLREVSPHVLRHCFASHLLSGGADLRIVQELLGHADIGTTQIYTHVDQDRLKAVHRKHHPRA